MSANKYNRILTIAVGPATLTLMFVIMTVISWRKWADPLIDYGRQIYIPWEMLQGKVLYRDIAWMHGPLAEHFNMLVFWLAGVSLTVTFTVNLALIAVMTALIYHYFRRCTDELTATFLGLVLLPIFCFGHYTFFSCFNFVSPYNFDLTYGIFLNILLLACLQQHLYTPTASTTDPQPHLPPPSAALDTPTLNSQSVINANPGVITDPTDTTITALPIVPSTVTVQLISPWLSLVGLLWGLIFLTKAETMLAATAVVGSYFLLTTSASNWRRQLLQLLTIIALALLPSLLFLGYFLTKMPLATALQGISGNWYHILYSAPAQDPYYLKTLGLDVPLANLLFLGKLFLGYCGLMTFAIGSDYLLRRYVPGSAIVTASLTLITALLIRALDLPWGNLGRPLNLITVIGVGFLVAQLWPTRQQLIRQQQLLPLILWGIFSATILTKMLLHVRIYFYGFALALGATMFVLAFSLYIVPKILQQTYGGGHYCRLVFLSFWAFALVFYITTCYNVYHNKTLVIGEQANQFYGHQPDLNPLAGGLHYALQQLRPRIQPQQTVMVFPEGAMLNFQLQRLNPTPYSAFTPYDFYTYGGEAKVLDSIKQHPPDFVVLVHMVSASEIPPFGNDPRYGQSIMNWLRANYRQIALSGAQPFTSQDFGVAIWQRQQTVSTNTPTTRTNRSPNNPAPSAAITLGVQP